MNAEAIVTLFIILLCAVPMVIIGVVQIKSTKPVGFWSGVKPPAADKVSDIPAYNKKHGIMWICYGVGMLVAFYGGVLFGEFAGFIALLVECFGGIFVMVVYHTWLEKKYVSME